MKFHLRFAALALFLLLCMICVPVFASESTNDLKYPEGVIEVPKGTLIEISGDDTVTIINNPAEIEAGDTFIVYLQDLPLGYYAKSVEVRENDTIIKVSKADRSVYALLNEEGVVELTPDMYSFTPAQDVTYTQSGISIGGGDGLNYKDGTLTMKKTFGGNAVQVSLSNLQLSHTASDGNMSLTLSGSWKISVPALSTSTDILDDVPLGVLRIAGIGKITVKTSMTIGLSMTCNFSGSFSVGFTTSDDSAGCLSSSFNGTGKEVSGKGNISASLKITAGVDILIAEADIYGEVGLTTEVTTQSKTDSSDHTVRCENYRFYAFLKAGAEAKFMSPTTGKMKPLAGYEFTLPDEVASPFSADIHFENGLLTPSCTQGMKISNSNKYGGFVSSFGSTLLSDNRERVLETDVILPWDLEVDGDYHISHGNLKLNGKTLTINGNLIQSGGTLTIGKGTLIVHGDYRIQSVVDDIYASSTGTLIMNDSYGSIIVDGNFIVQSNSTENAIKYGTININGDFEQINPSEGNARYNFESGLRFIFTADSTHTVKFEDIKHNRILNLILMNDVLVDSGICLGNVEFNNHQLTIRGDLISTGYISLNGLLLPVGGSLYHQDGRLSLDGGKLTVGNNYYCVGGNSVYGGSDREYTTGRGYLVMANEADEMHVGGDFVVRSNSISTLSAGTLYIDGNFRQIGTEDGRYAINGYSSAFSASVNHKTIFTKTDSLEIAIEGDNSGFGELSIMAEHVSYRGNIDWLKLMNDLEDVTGDDVRLNSRRIQMDMNGHNVIIHSNVAQSADGSTGLIQLGGGNLTVHGNATLCALKFNGGSCNIYGDMTLYAFYDTNLSGGTLNITGSFYNQYGGISLDGGKLTVGNNYYCVGGNSVYGGSDREYTTGRGYLVMANEADEMHVGGDFVVRSQKKSTFSAGTLYIGGNFRQIGTDYDVSNYNGSSEAFSASVNHTTVLTGTKGKRTIFFEGSRSHFGTLKLARSLKAYEFTPDPCWLALIQPPAFKDPDFILPESIVIVEDSAFEGIAANVVYIPDSCTHIGEYAFCDSAITQIRIPANCSIGLEAFAGCEDVIIFGAVDSEAEAYCLSHENCTFVLEEDAIEE